MSFDPMFEKTGTPYQYTYQNPINYTDPTGMEPDGWGRKGNQWTYDENITQDNYKDLGYSDYSDGTTNNTYTSANNTQVTLNSDGSWNERGLTNSGELYGGDGSGSFMDWTHRIVYETDQYNPVALAWDGIQGYITGADRFGNGLNTAGSTLKIAMAIPIGKIGGGLYKAEQGIVNIASNSVAKTGFSLTKHGELTNGIYTVSQEAMKKHVFGGVGGKSLFYPTLNANEAVLKAAQYADEAGLWIGNKAKVPVLNTNIGTLGNGQPTNIINVYKNSNGFIHGSPGTVK